MVYVRVGEQCHGVLMPAYNTVDSAVAYHDFLRNDHETLRVSSAWFNEEKQRWEVSPEPTVTHWPKNDDSFEFES